MDGWWRTAQAVSAMGVAGVAFAMAATGSPCSAVLPVQVGALWMLNEVFHPLPRLTKFVVSFRCWPGRRATRERTQTMQVAKVTDTVGTMHGHRAIIFTFITSNLGRHTVTFDFYGAGHIFNGKRYCEIEAAALRSAVTAGLDVIEYSHYITA